MRSWNTVGAAPTQQPLLTTSTSSEDPHDLNHRRASAAAGLEPHGHTPWSVPGGSRMFAAGKSTISPPFFLELTSRALLPRNAAHNDICSQYACANNMLVQLLYESSSTSSTSTSEEEDSRSIVPFLQGEKNMGRASDPRERALDLVGKEEDRGSPVSIPPTWSICDSHKRSRAPPRREGEPAPRELCVLCSQADNTQTVCIPTRNVARAEKNTQPEMLPALAYVCLHLYKV